MRMKEGRWREEGKKTREARGENKRREGERGGWE